MDKSNSGNAEWKSRGWHEQNTHSKIRMRAPIKSIGNSVMPTCLSFRLVVQGLKKKSCFIFPSLSSALQHRLTKANIYWNTSIESLKDKSAIVKIDTSALIKKLIALSVDRELDFVDFKSGRSRRKRRMWRKRWAAVIHTESIPGSFWPQVSVTELI